jgi:hypothetical protein
LAYLLCIGIGNYLFIKPVTMNVILSVALLIVLIVAPAFKGAKKSITA